MSMASVCEKMESKSKKPLFCFWGLGDFKRGAAAARQKTEKTRFAESPIHCGVLSARRGRLLRLEAESGCCFF